MNGQEKRMPLKKMTAISFRPRGQGSVIPISKLCSATSVIYCLPLHHFQAAPTKCDTKNVLQYGTYFIKSEILISLRDIITFVRSGVNNFLDVARITFLQCVEDIYSLAETYSTQYDMEVKVCYTTSRGYFVQVPYEAGSALPKLFIQV